MTSATAATSAFPAFASVVPAVVTFRDFHVGWAWFVIVGNGLAGVWALGAHRLPPLRTRALWWFTVFVEVAFFVQVALGVWLVSREKLTVEPFHMFYGFVALATIGIIYSYRSTSAWVREHRYLVYGLGGLFLMGLGIRAILVG